MRVMGLREAKNQLSALGQRTQRGQRVLITRHGKPLMVVVGVAGRSLEEVLLCWDPRFWKMIDSRRRERTVSARDAERMLFGPVVRGESGRPGGAAAARDRRRNNGAAYRSARQRERAGGRPRR